MKFKLFSKTIPAFGLDISGSSFKFMQLDGPAKNLGVKAYADVAVPKSLIANDVITDNKTFLTLLKQSLDRPQFGRLTTNYVVASLPESKSFVRVIQIPKMSEGEADNAVPFEAENFIPLPLDQVYLDWEKIGEEGDKMVVLMVAAPKEFVDGYMDLLEKAGLKPAALEVESQSCRRAVLLPDSRETVLLVDIEAYRSSMIMVENGSLQFTSTIPIAGNSFTESVAKALGVSAAKAEEIKRKVGIANTAEYPNIKTSLLPVLGNLEAEIKNILKFHGEHSSRQVERIILSGGSAKLKNLAEYLGPQMSGSGVARVELANPWLNVGSQKQESFQEDSLSFVTAIGLALRGGNYEIT
ncbi:MAG: type IV pilus assembly protein PilM [Candidatus Doudnabacteria bacterium]|nr:type IV pilus assembly protein PilM [Candidatus Doudnabacteria bacterium]